MYPAKPFAAVCAYALCVSEALRSHKHSLASALQHIFAEFSTDLDPAQEGSGDVKYHLGSSHDRVTRTGKTVCTLNWNFPAFCRALLGIETRVVCEVCLHGQVE